MPQTIQIEFTPDEVQAALYFFNVINYTGDRVSTKKRIDLNTALGRKFASVLNQIEDKEIQQGIKDIAKSYLED